MKKLIIITLAAALFFTFSSCSKNKNKDITPAESAQKPGTTVPQSKTAVKLKHINGATASYISDKTIAVVLGHSYNDEATVSSLTQLLYLNYGLETEETSGLIKVMVYPQDFMVAGKVRLSNLYSVLEDKKLAGLITIGAPEGLCNAIARLEDKEEANDETGNKRTYPVYSFFPQDDILGSESTSDFVLDFLQTAGITEEAADYEPYEVSTLLLNSVQSMINQRGPVPQDKNLQAFVQKLAGRQKKIKPYFDSETGLQSVNHFIFE